MLIVIGMISAICAYNLRNDNTITGQYEWFLCMIGWEFCLLTIIAGLFGIINI